MAPFRIIIPALLLTLSSPVNGAEPGLIDSFQSTLPATLWSGNISTTAETIHDSATSHMPALNTLRQQILLSQSHPALTADASTKLAAARLRYLWNSGALDAAEALATLFHWSADSIRAEVENIALLSTRPDRYCEGLLEERYSEIAAGVTIYCLALSDRWSDAVAEFERQEADLPTRRAAALRRFLDLVHEDEEGRNTPWLEIGEPFDFILDESIGRPRGTLKLPPPYAYFSLESGVTPRTDIEITEELVRLGALPSHLLFRAYRQHQSVESGGAWGRAEIIQQFDKFDPTEPSDLGSLLSRARERFAPAHLLTLFANEAGDKLTSIAPHTIKDLEVRREFIVLALMGSWSKPEWRALIADDDVSLLLAYQLRHDLTADDPARDFEPRSPIEKIAHQSFHGALSPLHAENVGEAIWQSTTILDRPTEHPTHLVIAALQTLVFAGQNDVARDIAVSLLLDGTPE